VRSTRLFVAGFPLPWSPEIGSDIFVTSSKADERGAAGEEHAPASPVVVGDVEVSMGEELRGNFTAAVCWFERARHRKRI
jgi:hypothetical protein